MLGRVGSPTTYWGAASGMVAASLSAGSAGRDATRAAGVVSGPHAASTASAPVAHPIRAPRITEIIRSARVFYLVGSERRGPSSTPSTLRYAARTSRDTAT